LVIATALLQKTESILRQDGVSLGELDLSVEGFYRNVVTFPLAVKKNRVLYIDVKAGTPVDVAVANEGGFNVMLKQGVSEGRVGPIPTLDNREMSVLLGVYPGDKTKADIEVWMERT